MRNEYVEAVRDEFNAAVVRLDRQQKRGRLSEDEFEASVRGLQVRLTNDHPLGYGCAPELNAAQWERLQRDYGAWAVGLPFEPADAGEWLKPRAASCERPIAELKKEFFDYRDALCLGIREFEPLPGDIERPAIDIPLYPDSQRAMDFPCDELKRFLARPPRDAAGAERVFTLDNGIELHISIAEVADGEASATMTGSGYVTEYMLPQSRPIEVTAQKGGDGAPVVWFAYRSEEDLQCFFESPRFQPYLTYVRAHDSLALKEAVARVRKRIDGST